MEPKIELRPIGIIHSPYKTRKNAPPQGCQRPEVVSEIEVFNEYSEGLKDIEGFSHLHVLYWLHKSEAYQLKITTPWDTELHGLFTTRSPNRPNPIGYSIVQLVGRHENLLRVRGLDALEGTLLLDIKPYVEGIDEVENARAGWLEGRLKIFTH